MKYLILIYRDPRSRDARLSHPDAVCAGARAHVALADELAGSGEMIAAEMLTDPSQTKRVLMCERGVATIDGPFTEASEYLAGFYLVECESVDRAVERAARAPEAADGLVEVRPVLCRSGLEM